MKSIRHLSLACAMIMGAGPVAAADFSDPTWPCVQRKVENLSLGLMWPHTPQTNAEELSPRGIELADTLSLRRLSVEEIQERIDAFAAETGGKKAQIEQVFARVFESLSKRRSRVIKGIGKFSLSQIALAKQIDATRLEMDALLSKEEPDFDKVDLLEEQIDWDQVIHSDRQRSITYLCETPQLIEKRLFAIGQMLGYAIND